MRPLLFAANWKMHLGPDEARAYLKAFRAHYNRHTDREVWFFPPAVSVEAAAQAARERGDLLVGIQDIHWEPKGAFTGAVSAPLALQAGARASLIGHSERRHVFGETDDDTRRKVGAALAAGLLPVLCVGETLAERDAGHTLAVVVRQLAAALSGLDGAALCADMTARISDTNRKMPAHHQVTLVSRVVAWRPPMNCSVPAPPPSDARPPPWPACSRTAVVRIRASSVRRISSKVYMRRG